MATSADQLAALRRIERDVCARLIAAHKGVWPRDMDCKYTVVQRDGKVEIRMERLYGE